MGELAMPATEIHALARILDELDYYGLLHVPRGASAADVKRGGAWHIQTTMPGQS